MTVRIPQELVKHIQETTGIPEKTIMKILKAERQYYLKSLQEETINKE